MNKILSLVAVCVLALSGTARAAESPALTAIIALEPTSKKDGMMLSRTGMATSLGKLVGSPMTVSASEDLADVMRATRSAGYDVFVAPPQVAASALQHGYELVGSTDRAEQYLLIGRNSLASAKNARGARIYLPQQDSIYTYMARGMLNANGLSLKDLSDVRYERYPQAGLTALAIGASDLTVVRQSDWDEWANGNPGMAKVLATSTPVPGGLSVVVKKELPPEMRTKMTAWFANSAPAMGLKPVTVHDDLREYKSVAELGVFTPLSLPGAKLVHANEVQELVAQGAVLVDARNDKEYGAKHIPGAVLIPYVEKSLKDIAFDAKQDDFSGLAKLDLSKPTIFACNGPECWKSYKASRVAISKGMKTVYWFRGGLPEWEASGMTVARQ